MPRYTFANPRQNGSGKLDLLNLVLHPENSIFSYFYM